MLRCNALSNLRQPYTQFLLRQHHPDLVEPFNADALLRVIYTDGKSYDTQLSFQPYIGVEQVLSVSTIINTKADVDAIVVVLRCNGFRGKIHFWDVRADVHTTGHPTVATYCPHVAVANQSDNDDTLGGTVIKHKIAPVVNGNGVNAVTLVTHASVDRLSTLINLARTWHGPLCVVVYVACCAHQPSRLAYVDKKLREASNTGDLSAWTVLVFFDVTLIAQSCDTSRRHQFCLAC